MTWNEFKQYVDQVLREMGVDGDVELDYIDVVVSRPADIEVAVGAADDDVAIYN